MEPTRIDSDVVTNMVATSNGGVPIHDEEYAPSDELLDKLANLNFDFVTDNFK